MPIAVIDSPVGMLKLEERENQIVRISWVPESLSMLESFTPILERTRSALEYYFAGVPDSFQIPISPTGSKFQQNVWQEIQAIPRGETRTYGDLAHALDSTPRAIGAACGSNPIPIIIPCHRVVAVTGLGGYSGGSGLDTKIFLLCLEGVHLV